MPLLHRYMYLLGEILYPSSFGDCWVYCSITFCPADYHSTSDSPKQEPELLCRFITWEKILIYPM